MAVEPPCRASSVHAQSISQVARSVPTAPSASTRRARAAWGQSNNKVSPFQTYTDEFDTNRQRMLARHTAEVAGRCHVKRKLADFHARLSG